MGIDLKSGGRRKQRSTRKPKTTNVQLRGLIKYYTFLFRRTQSDFYKAVLKRLCQSRTTRCPISLSRIVKNLGKKPERTVVIVGTVTNDLRLLEVPKLKVCALHFTTQARARIVKAGGQCLTFDQLPLTHVNGRHAFLMRGPRFREVKRHFGLAPGQKGSTTAPYVRAKSRKFEQGRGTH
jgi:large subunit ribosomal protein L18e